MGEKPRILVIGSINMDVVLKAEKFPAPGETVLGTDLSLIPGGKGANQAVALSRLGASSSLLGRVGADPWGKELAGKLSENGVDTENVAAVDSLPTGNATIIVDQEGENRIVLIAGANDALLPEDVDLALAGKAAWDAILLQLEIPLETVCHAISAGAARGIPVILDAGPPVKLSLEKLRGVTVLSPNESETEALTGIRPDGLESASRAAALLEKSTGAREVVLKLGDRGALCRNNGQWEILEAHRVDVVDTTAAGDSFTAALAIEYTRETGIKEAARRAIAAGALAVTRLGAQPSLPTAEEVDRLLERAG
ncbi:MAG: ribokinase [Planctomycetota bacterium]|nr:ribokinase [Planctomycetota bacterium]